MFFKKKPTSISNRYSYVAMMNPHIDLIHDACKICWDKPPETTVEGKLKYIQARVHTGHESIMEHSNLVMEICVPHKYYSDVLDITPTFKYLNYKITETSDKNIVILIGGSIRGYKHVFRNIADMSNIIALRMRDNLYLYTPKEYYSDFINDGIFNEIDFRSQSLDDLHTPIKMSDDRITDKVEVVNVDNLDALKEILNGYDVDYSTNDLLDMCTITVLFKGASRSCTHQLVRHRNGITQESTRYTDYSDTTFYDPIIDKSFYKEKDKKYNVTIGGIAHEVTSTELGKMLMDIYPQLMDQGMQKEDARAFLPTNVQCRKLYMTFTFRTMLKFLELRTHKAAQVEIRLFAEDLYKIFLENSNLFGNVYRYLDPKYMYIDGNYDVEAEVADEYYCIDEVIDEPIEVIEDIKKD